MIDWFPLRDAVREVSLKYPQVTWVIAGTTYKWIHDHIPPAQLEFHDWVDYNAYRPTRMIYDADINLCPLNGNSKFNESKSAIKWYEGCMPYAPEATLAGNTAPYSDEMVDGETGLLYNDPKEFAEKLGILIENSELRKKLGKAAKEWVIQNRHYKVTAPGLFDFYRELRKRKAVALEA